MLLFKELKRLLPLHKENLTALESICRAKDGTVSSVCSSTEFNCRRDIPVFFLAMDGTKLVGYLSVFLPEETSAEINVLIHPDYRRQGIFTALLLRAKTALSAVGTKEFIFVCEPSATDSTAAMLAMQAEKRSSEYRMLLESSSASALSPCNTGASSRLTVSGTPGKLLEATPDDLPLLGKMNALFFETSEEMGELFAEDSYYTPGITVYKYVITDEHKKTVPIGTVCFYEEEHSGNIFGLGILPEYRGHGYGKDLLSALLTRIPADKKIYLQVSGRNAAAFQLYQKTGFKITAQQDFWLLP